MVFAVTKIVLLVLWHAIEYLKIGSRTKEMVMSFYVVQAVYLLVYSFVPFFGTFGIWFWSDAFPKIY